MFFLFNISLRRSTVESTLTSYTCHYIYNKQFQRYNLAKFPCSLKRLEISYEKLVDLCIPSLGSNKKKTSFKRKNCSFFVEEDDEKWLTKLNASKWLRYVSKALKGAASLAKLLNYKNIQLCGKKKSFIFYPKFIFLLFR